MRTISAIVVSALFLLLPMLAERLDPNGYEGGRSRDAQARAERNSSAFAAILGELRTSFSDILFVKTERYLDNGIGYAPHSDPRALSVESETAELDEHQSEVLAGDHSGHDHGDEHGGAMPETLVRTPDQDFRGIVGMLEREVKPWRDPSLPHEHTDGTELLPWYRIMTMADPKDIRAYAIGAWWLKSIDPEQGITFLKEGIANNPDSFTLYNMLGQIYYAQGNEIRWQDESNIEQAQPYFEQAQEAFESGAEFAMEQRPPDGPTKDNPQWTDYMEEDALAAIRMAVLVEKRYGDPAHARELALSYLEKVDDAVLRRSLE